MKPTFQQIAHHYLGESLNATYTDTFGETAVGTLDGVDTRCQRVHIDGCVTYDCKPHFRPLSSLTQEIEPGVIGLVDFLKPEINLTGQKIERIGNMFYARDAFGNAPVFHFHESTSLPLPKWQWLLRHHFNIFNLDESEFIAI